ncbi:signal peptidase I [Clostridium omnivorum]|uniref:Signal peptidase I n=1 Tax=Clostridium omnivorum TaxID=1604902 RepID=A0ABQ5N5X6_9CLOT|nr:signal peptidase I [Clostridium sp. E14]GLC30531.1 S26 family signal peptidase [Clostridium sp. E14]
MIKRLFDFIKNILSNKIAKKIFNYAGTVIIILLIILVAVSIYGKVETRGKTVKVPSAGSYMWLSVLSGSMSPVFNTGDLVIDKKVDPKTLKKGDIVTYYWNLSFLSTHRIVDIQYDKDGKPYFQTKGDANKDKDTDVVLSEQIVGKYLFRIPYAGYVISKLKGLAGVVVIWIMFFYVIGKEIYSQIKEKNNKKEDILENSET